MREVEFRIWSEKDNKYLCYAPLKTLLNTKDRTVKLTQDNITLEQYTGLKDKNGKKIFEGDRLRYNYKDRQGEEICEDVVNFNPQSGYYPLNLGCICEDSFYNTYATDFEIISNIHEGKGNEE